MALLDLANELLLSVANNFTSESDINALAQTNRRLYSLLNLPLYRYAVQRHNHSALFWAAFHGFSSIACMLLAEGAGVRAVTIPRKLTALHLASRRGHLVIVDALIQKGADVNAESSTGATPLHDAVLAGFEGVTRTLLENGANVNAESSTGATPLHEAALAGFEGVTRILLENGADYMKRLHHGDRQTALHIASWFGNTTVVQLLLEKGMGIEVKDEDLRTPLHYAIEFDRDSMLWYGNIETVAFLLEQRANKEAWDNLGRRPKDLAKGHPSAIVELLLQDVSLDEAILIEQRQQVRKEQEVAKQCKANELAAECAAKRKARLRGARKLKEEQLCGQIEEAKERQDREEWEKLADISRQEREEVIRQGWARMRAEAGENSKIPGRVTRPSPCRHPALGWLKCKKRAQCGECKSVCAKYSFICGDCSFVVCLLCKAHASSGVRT